MHMMLSKINHTPGAIKYSRARTVPHHLKWCQTIVRHLLSLLRSKQYFKVGRANQDLQIPQSFQSSAGSRRNACKWTIVETLSSRKSQWGMLRTVQHVNFSLKTSLFYLKLHLGMKNSNFMHFLLHFVLSLS